MLITLDNNDCVSSYAFIGHLDGGIKICPPSDPEHFEAHYRAYKLISGELTFDEKLDLTIAGENAVNALRDQREEECFTIINRGALWYETLSEAQKNELTSWYRAWLHVTETMTVPDKPSWL